MPKVPYTLGKQVSFDVFAGMLYTFFHSMQDTMKLAEGQVKWAVSVLAAFLASLVACIFSQPGDMILTETYSPKKKVVTRYTNASRSSAASDKSVLAATKSRTTPVASRKPSAAAVKDDRSFVDVVRAIHDAGGLSNFFTGTGARIVHVGVIITSQLVIYDVIKQLLGLPATGSH